VLWLCSAAECFDVAVEMGAVTPGSTLNPPLHGCRMIEAVVRGGVVEGPCRPSVRCGRRMRESMRLGRATELVSGSQWVKRRFLWLTCCIATPDIEMAQRKLMQQVWSQAEREAFTQQDGGDWALSNGSKDRVEQARRAQVENIAHGERVLAEWARSDRARPEREYRPIPQANFGGLQFNFGGLQNAVAGVEEEMEVDDATAAMQQTEIGAKKPWEKELADRTK
jgi:hypothetical protein